jgi:cytochrome c556
MLKRLGGLAPAFGVLTVVALAAGIASSATMPTVNDSMTHVMSVHAQTIWDISSAAFNEKGDGLVAKKITPSGWKKLAEAGRRLRERASLLAKAERVIVAARDEHILGEEAAHGGPHDAASVKQIQAMIDHDPKQFVKRAMTLAEAGEALEKAAKARDVRGVYKVSSNLDEVCDGCHEPFWGTDEPPAVPKNEYIPVLVGR